MSCDRHHDQYIADAIAIVSVVVSSSRGVCTVTSAMWSPSMVRIVTSELAPSCSR